MAKRIKMREESYSDKESARRFRAALIGARLAGKTNEKTAPIRGKRTTKPATNRG
jgi:hypothetical protein